jgi:hypothetical protein
MPLTVKITRVCESYPDSAPVCADQDAKQDLGVAVNLAIGGGRYDPAARQFTWTSWPTGQYDAVTSSCDGTTELPMPPTGQTASCTVPENDPSPSLVVRVVSGGTAYSTTYPGSTLQ